MSKGRRKGVLKGLTQREQEVMEIIYKQESCSANTIQQLMSGSLNNATVRTILRKMEEKGVLQHEKKGNKFFYKAMVNRETIAKQKFRNLIDTFFSGSVTDAVAMFIDEESMSISAKELDELKKLIEDSRKKMS